MPLFLARLAGILALTLFLAADPNAAFAASPDTPAPQSSEGAGPRSEAAEAWDAVKATTNRALLEAFIKRYGTTFFAEIARARLDELNAAAARPRPPLPAIPAMPKDGARERVVLYEEDPSDAKGRQFDGAVIWRLEKIKAAGQPDELAAHAEIDIPSRGLRVTILLKRNLDPSLPASHVCELTLAVPGDFNNGKITNVPGILMKSNEQARGTPLAGLAVKITEGFFLVGLSNVAADRERNLSLLSYRAWFDIPIVYANQRRAIVTIEKGETGDQVLKTVLTAWGQYPGAPQPATAAPDESNNTMPEEWRRTMMGRSKAQ
jgi:hypothetical protein